MNFSQIRWAFSEPLRPVRSLSLTELCSRSLIIRDTGLLDWKRAIQTLLQLWVYFVGLHSKESAQNVHTSDLDSEAPDLVFRHLITSFFSSGYLFASIFVRQTFIRQTFIRLNFFSVVILFT